MYVKSETWGGYKNAPLIVSISWHCYSFIKTAGFREGSKSSNLEYLVINWPTTEIDEERP